MAETALDLSVSLPPAPEERVPPPSAIPPQLPEVSSDSGRASTSSTSSNEEPRIKPDPDIQRSPAPVGSSQRGSSPVMEEDDDDDDEMNKYDDEINKYDEEMNKSDRVAPVRPFKMYPMDAYSMMNNQLAGMSGVGALSPNSAAGFSAASMAAMPAMMDPTAVSPFSLTPMTSHLLQRKRRAENRNISLEEMKKMNPVAEEKKDEAYWERRRKNNEAAKRSRDSRRMKEEEIAMRAAFLEQENLKLRAQVAILKNETAKLHYMLYNRM